MPRHATEAVAEPPPIRPVARLLPGEAALLRRHPEFRAATLAFARSGVELYQGNRFLNVVANDRGRFIVALLSVALHHGPGGLTATRLRAICAETGLCSPGRVRALLALMQWAGYLAAGPEGRLLPTPKLVEMHRERLSRQLAQVARVLPEVGPAVTAMAREEVVAGFCIAQSGRFTDGFRFLDFAPELSVFVERNAGLLVLFALYLADAGELPSSAASVAGLARRFHVSRPHVALMLRAAEAEGLIARHAEGVALSAGLMEGLARFFSAAFRLNADCAAAALAWAEARA